MPIMYNSIFYGVCNFTITMKKLKFCFISLISASALLLSSCAKSGCTDGNADNFCSECKKDDGSCNYSGSVVLWYDEDTADEMDTDGITSLIVEVDGEIVGTYSPSVYFTSAPNCGSTGTITVKKNLGKSKSKTSTYSITDQDGDVVFSGTLEFKANTCTEHELTY